LSPKVVNDIHKRGGTILGTSRGGHDTSKIVDSIEDRGINQVYIIGGDGTQRGANVIHEECKRRGLKVVVAGIPKTIDNDIEVSSRYAHWCNLRFSTLLLVVSTWQICYKLGNPTFKRSCSFSNY
jgi:6-phosphofructokinase